MRDTQNNSGANFPGGDGTGSPDPGLDALLRKAKANPELPPHFQQNVWRRIEDAEATTILAPSRFSSWLEALASFVLQPKFALTAAVLLLIAGTAAGTIEGRHQAASSARSTYLASVMPHDAR